MYLRLRRQIKTSRIDEAVHPVDERLRAKRHRSIKGRLNFFGFLEVKRKHFNAQAARL